MAPNTTGTQLIQDLDAQIKGKVVLITGTSPGGIGALFAEKLAHASPAMLILTGRNAGSIQPTVDAIRATNGSVAVKVLVVDFASLASVRAAAALVVDGWPDVPHIDVLVNNAGIMAAPWGKTEDGFEMHLGVNHLGPFLFTNLLLPKVLASATPRVVMVSSDGHRISPIRWRDYNFKDGKAYNRWRAYAQSKTANNLTALGLAKRLGSQGLQAFSLHPGVYSSNLSRHMGEMSEELKDMKEVDSAMGNKFGDDNFEFEYLNADQIIVSHIYAAFSDDLKDYNGMYIMDGHVADQYKEEVWPWSINEIEADKLWALSEKLVGQQFQH